MPLPRDPRKASCIFSIRRNETPRRANSSPRVSPAPAPQMRTSAEDFFVIMSLLCIIHIYGDGSLSSRGKVRNTRIGGQLRELHSALLDIVAVMNRPQGDEKLIRAAAIPLERAL